MDGIDWRALYAANQRAIARARTAPGPAAARLAGGSPARVSQPAGRHGHGTPPAPGRQAPLVHVPAGLDPLAPAPLVCMLHGCTQDPHTFAAATLMNRAADRHGFVVVYPGQDRRANAQCCWNWFLREHQRRGHGEPAAIAELVRGLFGTTSAFTVDPRRVFVAGLSSGGAMAAILGACYPDVFAAVAVHSGLAYGSATDLGGAYAAMAGRAGDGSAHGRAAHAAMGRHARAVPTIVVHGTADHTVVFANAVHVLRQSMVANHLAAPETCDHDVARPTTSSRGQVADGGYPYVRSRWCDRRGALMHELLQVDGLGHAWSGGAPGGSHADPRGPDASEAVYRFFVDAVR